MSLSPGPKTRSNVSNLVALLSNAPNKVQTSTRNSTSLTERSSTDSKRSPSHSRHQVDKDTYTLQVANKKQQDVAAQDAEIKRLNMEQAEQGKKDALEEPETSAGPADLLEAEGDEDVIF